MKERDAYELAIIVDWLAERNAELERKNTSLTFRAEFAEQEAANYRSRLEAEGLLEEGE